MGFAPVDNPKDVILMIVDEPNSYAYYGSIVAAPSVSRVYSKIFDYIGLEPTLVSEQAYVEMPQLEGKSYKQAVEELKRVGLQFEVTGEGGIILQTLPLAGERVLKGDVVLLGT